MREPPSADLKGAVDAKDGPEVLRVVLGNRLPEKTLRHTLSVEGLAAELARLYGAREDVARTAALLHDVTKAVPPDGQLKLCSRYGIMLRDQDLAVPSALHAVTGAAVARAQYGASEEVCLAVRYHTTGRAGMTLEEKIIWLADYAEPLRDFPGVDSVRRLLRRRLDAALVLALEQTVRYLCEQKRTVHLDAREAVDFMRNVSGEGSTLV